MSDIRHSVPHMIRVLRSVIAGFRAEGVQTLTVDQFEAAVDKVEGKVTA